MSQQSNIDSRINRLVGQIEGIRRMIRRERPVDEIAQQIMAARQALSKIGIIILKEGIVKTDPKDKERIEQLMSKVFRV